MSFLNHDGIQFYAVGRALCARDQLGRFMGEHPDSTDDEIIEYDLEHIAQDQSLGNCVSHDHSKFDDNAEPGDVSTFDDYYSETKGYNLWPEELELSEFLFGYYERWVSREELTEKWAEYAYKDQFPELWGDAELFIEDEVSVPTQSWTQHDDFLKKLKWERNTYRRSQYDTQGRRGKRKGFWWSKLAEIRRYNHRADVIYFSTLGHQEMSDEVAA